MTAPETPAALLRRAADRLDEIAAETSPEPWRGHVRDALVPWVALMSIEVAPRLSSWLRAEADCAEHLPEATDALSRLGAAVQAEVTQQPADPWGVKVTLSTAAQAVAFARTLLGETEKKT